MAAAARVGHAADEQDRRGGPKRCGHCAVDRLGCRPRPTGRSAAAHHWRPGCLCREDGGVTASMKRHVIWHHAASELLRLPPAPPPPLPDYVGPVAFWAPATVRAQQGDSGHHRAGLAGCLQLPPAHSAEPRSRYRLRRADQGRRDCNDDLLRVTHPADVRRAAIQRCLETVKSS